MHQQHRQVAGLDTCLIGAGSGSPLLIVFLHGFGMRAADLTPFAHSLAIPGVAYAFPEGPCKSADGGCAWWPVNVEARAMRGPRDLADIAPPGRIPARRLIRNLVLRLSAEAPERTILLAGFSQGAMLACDVVLFEPVPVAGLVMLSASCLALEEWQTRRRRLQGLPTLVSHGRDDADLGFSAGERLCGFLEGAGASVTWVPFAGGHEIPFPVWRQFRKFVRAAMPRSKPTHEQNPQHATH